MPRLIVELETDLYRMLQEAARINQLSLQEECVASKGVGDAHATWRPCSPSCAPVPGIRLPGPRPGPHIMHYRSWNTTSYRPELSRAAPSSARTVPADIRSSRRRSIRRAS